MFRLVSRKKWRRPFCPYDLWAGLTGHFSLLLFAPFFLRFLPAFFFVLLSSQKPLFAFFRWDGFHQVTDLSASAWSKTLQLPGNTQRPTAREIRVIIYTCSKVHKGTLDFSKENYFPFYFNLKYTVFLFLRIYMVFGGFLLFWSTSLFITYVWFLNDIPQAKVADNITSIVPSSLSFPASL